MIFCLCLGISKHDLKLLMWTQSIRESLVVQPGIALPALAKSSVHLGCGHDKNSVLQQGGGKYRKMEGRFLKHLGVRILHLEYQRRRESGPACS